MKMVTYTFHWNTQQGHRFKRFSSFSRWKGIYWRLFLYWQQLYRVIPHETSVRLVPGQSWSWRHFWEMNMLMLTRAAVTSLSNTFSQHTTLCSLRLTQVPQPRIRMTKGKMLHMYAVAASIAFLLYMVILFSSNNNSLILLFTNGNPWLYHRSSFEICNCNHYSLRKGF